MREFFVFANSFAAPFCSDTSTEYVAAENPAEALAQFAKDYRHPAGLFFAACWASADDYHKGKPALAEWKSNRVLAEERAKEGKGGYSFCGHGPGHFEIDGKHVSVDDPKGGRVVVPKGVS